MKITVKNFDDLTRAQMKEVIEQMGECYNVDYLTNDDYLEVVIRKKHGEEWEFDIEKDDQEDLEIGRASCRERV